MTRRARALFVTGCCSLWQAASTPRRRDGRQGPAFGLAGLPGAARLGVAARCAALGLLLSACSPALDWREVPIEGTDLVARFPCHPSRQLRQVDVAGRTVDLALTGCDAGGTTYGVATADVVDPAQVEPVLATLVESSRRAIGAPDAASRPLPLAGATPYRGNVSIRLVGRRSDGRAVEEASDVFARGTRVYQATAIAEALSASAVAPFQEGLRFGPSR